MERLETKGIGAPVAVPKGARRTKLGCPIATNDNQMPAFRRDGYAGPQQGEIGRLGGA